MPDLRSKSMLKILALLSSVRWYNILLIALAQYISALFIFNSFPLSIIPVIQDVKLHILVFCTLLVVAGGFLINDFYDFKHDLIVRPKTTLFHQYISKDMRIRLYTWCNLLAYVLALWGSFNIFIYFLSLSFSLWFYSHKLKKYPVVKEISASLLTVSCFFAITLYYHFPPLEIFLYGFYFFLLLLTRELVKGVGEFKASIVTQHDTVTTRIGEQRARKLIKIAIGCQWLFAFLLFQQFFPAYWLSFIGISSLLHVYIFVKVGHWPPNQFFKLLALYKVLIFLGLLHMVLFSL
jgi:4-hydroxybenzoate polyprenyltransferase